ncbi:MAG: hypothetical protein HY763_14220 [Planctomycetes bacterium]|nr:hypothetical protein [Planctomycetota bacterium]
MPPLPLPVPAAPLCGAAALLSAAVLGYEISLLRLLLIASYHHLAFLVISIALLGFGASGTALVFVRVRAKARGGAYLFTLSLATGASMPACWLVAQQIPVESLIVPAMLLQQAAWWMLYWTVLTLPFFVAAGALGLTLILAGQRVGPVYAGNLVGGALGAALAPVLMSWVAAEWLPAVMGGVAISAAMVVTCGHPARRGPRALAIVAAAAVCFGLGRSPARVDQFKDVAYLERLRHQGQARLVAELHGPRATLSAYASELLHDVPFLSATLTPPPITAILQDGHRAGSLLEVADAAEARIMDDTLPAIAYALAPASPRVLLLGEVGGGNAWLALRQAAAQVTWVQADANALALLSGPLAARGGAVLDQPGVRAVVAEPRHFLQRTAEPFDLIQLVGLETVAAGSGGIAGLGQEPLITVEALDAALDRLTDDGMVTITRGIETPPRDSYKLLATFAAALRARGVTDPGRYVVAVRDYLALCLMLKRSPWRGEQVERLRRLCVGRGLTPVWFDGITPPELNHPDELPAPPDGIGDWYYYGARRLLSEDAGAFLDSWPFDIRPPTDDRPYFHDFCKIRRLGALRQVYGDVWLTRVESGFLIVLIAAVAVGVGGGALAVLPLGMSRIGRRVPGKAAVGAYFAAIGLAYLMLEVTCLSRLTLWIGDPVLAAAVTIGTFLCLSGIGSALSGMGLTRTRGQRRLLFAALLLAGAGSLLILRTPAWKPVESGMITRCIAAIITIAPVALLMGFPMPLGLRCLTTADDAPAQGTPACGDSEGVGSKPGHVSTFLVPWAWGVNGFASVMAAPLATALGMAWGYHVAGAVALICYAVAAVSFARLDPRARGRGSHR